MIGTLRRELLDRILILNERYLQQILTTYLHQSRAKKLGSEEDPLSSPG